MIGPPPLLLAAPSPDSSEHVGAILGAASVVAQITSFSPPTSVPTYRTYIVICTSTNQSAVLSNTPAKQLK